MGRRRGTRVVGEQQKTPSSCPSPVPHPLADAGTPDCKLAQASLLGEGKTCATAALEILRQGHALQAQDRAAVLGDRQPRSFQTFKLFRNGLARLLKRLRLRLALRTNTRQRWATRGVPACRDGFENNGVGVCWHGPTLIHKAVAGVTLKIEERGKIGVADLGVRFRGYNRLGMVGDAESRCPQHVEIVGAVARRNRFR